MYRINRDERSFDVQEIHADPEDWSRKEMLPQKLPNKYRISLHIDDEAIICTLVKQYGYNVYQLEA